MQVKLQDVSVLIDGTSRYNGNKYDIAHVQTLLVTDKPIPTDKSWYVPAGTSIPKIVKDFFKASDVTLSPIYESNLLKGVEDIGEQAKQRNLKEVMNDASRYLLQAVMKKVPLTPISGSNNTYRLSYEYKIYPVINQDYELNITVPFDGLNVQNGGRIQLSIITPIGAKIDANQTKGIAENGQEIKELISNLSNVNRQVVSFGWQRDPDFTIRYRY